MTNEPFRTMSPARGTPATRAVNLTTGMISDTADLAGAAKALRIYNGSSAAITVLVTPEQQTDVTSAGAIPITVPAGIAETVPLSVRRIWSTGSTGLAAGITAGTVCVTLYTL